MANQSLYIFVEGDDDERFFERTIKPKLQKRYGYVGIVKYAEMPKRWDKLEKFLKSIDAMGAEYIYVTDINNSPCVTAKKKKIKGKLSSIDEDRIIVVIKEIESWYLAGLDNEACKKLKIQKIQRYSDNTNNITKEQFDSLIPKKFDSRIDFMSEILKKFSIKTQL